MKTITVILSAIALLAFTSCDKDEPETPVIPNEEEVITTLTYLLTDSETGDVVLFEFRDLDGDGGNPPTIIADTLQSNRIYNGSITLYNELETPPEDITEEVEEEGTEHQMFYISSSENVSVFYTDTDADGNPLGIDTQLVTTDSGNGTLTIVLKHEPDKNAEGVSEGDITNAGGETDIEIVFNVVVE